MIELKDTVELMTSSDYKDRFKAEYFQLKTRVLKLRDMLDKWDHNALSFTPTCPRSLYDWQMESMLKYMAALEARATIENVDIH
jgi:hypothetical protein